MIKILNDYIDILRKHDLLKGYSDDLSILDTPVKGITYDSKKVSDGFLFICKGAAFKPSYLSEAAANGAIAYVSEKEYPDVDLFCIQTDNIREAMPYLGELFYDFPQKKLHITGVGGTKGKSTTSYYIKSILDNYLKKNKQKESAIISSIDVYDGVASYESHITTPESLELMEHFNNAVNSDINYLTMEVSSQALKYRRVDEITFDVGIFLNISEDHISPVEHVDFEDYISSKLKMFSKSKVAVVNKHSDFSERILQAASVCDRLITFGYTKNCDIYGYDIKKEGDSLHFRVKTSSFDKPFVLTMPGLFNIDNALAAIGTCIVYNIPYENMFEGLYQAASPGRMEMFRSNDGKITAIVDYAHNKLSFQKLFESVKEEFPNYNIVSIFGCPGNKAVTRRKDLGEEAARNADLIYIVAEDPGSEPVENISNDIASFITPFGTPFEIIEDRGEAIKKAVLSAPENTVILITGKGRETRQKYGTEYVDCPSDVDFTLDALDKYNSSHENGN